MSRIVSGVRDNHRRSLIAVLFGVLPPLLLIAIGLHLLQHEREYRIESAGERLDAAMGPIAGRLDPTTDAGRRLKSLADLLNRRCGTGSDRNRHCLFTALLEGIEPCLFDGAGNLVTPETVPLRSKFVVQRLWRQLTSLPSPARPGEEKKLLKTFCAAFGADFRVADLRRREGLPMMFRVRRKDGCMLWLRAKNQQAASCAGCLLISWSGSDQRSLLRRIAAKSGRSGMPDEARRMQLFVRLPGDGWRRVSGPRMRKIPAALRPLLAEKSAASLVVDSRLWMYSRAGDAEILASRLIPGADIERAQRALILLGIIFSALGFVSVRRMIESAPLRLKLALVFLLAAALPIAGLGFLGVQMLRDRRDTAVNDARNAGRELLVEIDREFGNEATRYRADFRGIRDDARWRTDAAAAASAAVRMIECRRLGRFEVRDISGKICIDNYDPSLLEGMENIFDTFAMVCMESALPGERLRLSKRPIDPVAKMIFDSPEMGFPYITAHPDVVHLFRFGNRSFMWYWDVFPDPSHPFAYINLVQSTNDAARQYLEKRLKTREALNGVAWRLLAWERARESWLPQGASASGTVVHLGERVRLTGQPWSGRIEVDGETFQAAAIPGDRLAGFTMLALYPMTAVEREILAGRDFLVISMACILLIAFLTGGILADTFLAPVAELARGLAAVRGRTFNVMLSVSQKDELGDLTGLFNRMVAELRQMDMARCVQEALIPKDLPRIPGWDFDLVNLTASDLGGDYCDILRLRNDSILFLIGDVTGHGAASALLMVMVKTAVMRFIESGDSPDDLLTRLNHLVFRLMNRRRMMSCVIGLLEPATGRIRMANAGHPYPFRKTAAGGVAEIQSSGFPLGVNERKLRLQPVDFQLNPGDALILYTDGLVEGMDADGDMFGYERIHETARVTRGDSANALRAGIVDAFFRHHTDLRLEDDLTMVVVRRHD